MQPGDPRVGTSACCMQLRSMVTPMLHVGLSRSTILIRLNETENMAKTLQVRLHDEDQAVEGQSRQWNKIEYVKLHLADYSRWRQHWLFEKDRARARGAKFERSPADPRTPRIYNDDGHPLPLRYFSKAYDSWKAGLQHDCLKHSPPPRLCRAEGVEIGEVGRTEQGWSEGCKLHPHRCWPCFYFLKKAKVCKFGNTCKRCHHPDHQQWRPDPKPSKASRQLQKQTVRKVDLDGTSLSLLLDTDLQHDVMSFFDHFAKDGAQPDISAEKPLASRFLVYLTPGSHEV
mmetsp:Transcript_43529/g.137696  ORF Transcript_43529/g.137696 Transcript_43529/m.137696 type:complete len:286 (-) Transcript_43529:66-923(-)